MGRIRRSGCRVRIGVFGGTFDPPHIAHLILAGEALVQLNLERVLWVLTPMPPHKPGRTITSLTQRVQMVQAALEGNPNFVLSTVEIDRSPPHYAVETMGLLQSQFPGCELVYLMGSDSLRDLPNWYCPKEFVRRCTNLGVMKRPGAIFDLRDLQVLDKSVPGVVAKVQFFSAPMVDISASMIRQRIAAKEHYQYYLPPSVFRLVQEMGIYSKQ